MLLLTIAPAALFVALNVYESELFLIHEFPVDDRAASNEAASAQRPRAQ